MLFSMLPAWAQASAPLTGYVSGTVTDYDGEPVANAHISFWDPVTDAIGWAQTDVYGDYVSTGLTPGTYVMTVTPPQGFHLLQFTIPEIVVTPGYTTLQDVELKQGGLVSGTVTDYDGEPVANAHISFWDPVTDASGWAQTDAFGDYVSTGLTPGTYEMTIYPPHGVLLLPVTIPGIAVTAGATTPQDVVLEGLNVTYAPGAGRFNLTFISPVDEYFAFVHIYYADHDTDVWKPAELVFEPDHLPGSPARTIVNLRGNYLLGKDRVKFKVVAIDVFGEEIRSVVADNKGEGYLMVACYKLIPGPDGWRTFSVPVRLAAGKSLLGDVINPEAVEIAFKFDAAQQRWIQVTAANNTIMPLEAVYVKLREPVLAKIVPSIVPTEPPTRNLAEGWNLVGFTRQDPVEVALHSVRELGPGINARPGWSVAVNPAVNGQPWVATSAMSGYWWYWHPVNPYNGYWVFMDGSGRALVGFSTTPVTVDTYVDTYQAG
jgi:hypothetical protein